MKGEDTAHFGVAVLDDNNKVICRVADPTPPFVADFVRPVTEAECKDAWKIINEMAPKAAEFKKNHDAETKKLQEAAQLLASKK